MKVAVFSTKSYDKEYFEKFNDHNQHQITYFEAPLNLNTTNLTQGFQAVCVFVNDKCRSSNCSDSNNAMLQNISL